MNKLLIVSVLFLLACKSDDSAGCLTSAGKIEKEMRSVEAFEKIIIYDDLDVDLIQDSLNFIVVETGTNLINGIQTTSQNNTLKIEEVNRCNWVRDLKIKKKIIVHYSTLKSIEFYGVGKLICLTPIKTDSLYINLFKSGGDLNLTVETKLVELKSHTGTGTITCNGSTEDLVVFMGSTSFINSLNTSAKKVLAVSENIGKLSVAAEDHLTAVIEGRGDIEYIGDPTINSTISGNGKLIKID